MFFCRKHKPQACLLAEILGHKCVLAHRTVWEKILIQIPSAARCEWEILNSIFIFFVVYVETIGIALYSIIFSQLMKSVSEFYIRYSEWRNAWEEHDHQDYSLKNN